ncbi:MAG: CoA pyrophosphatase [Gemmatimonadaceae bacterium]|nr:CoA pyrophosphatase [Gemmatimonadaceae bacterium]
MTASELDGLASHPLLVRFSCALAERPGRIAERPGARRAAILLLLRSRSADEPELLMIRRAEFEGDPWSGHVACPGGRMEPGDADLAVTAVRETFEETGIDVSRDGRLLGHLDDLSPRSALIPQIVIRPYVALVRYDVHLSLSDEVAAAFWVPLSALREQSAWSTGIVTAHGAQRSVSTFTHGEHLVWGLTERVLRQFLTYLGIPPNGESIDDDATGAPR